MKVLVAFASKHGSTAEIGERIGERLAQKGVEVSISDIESAAAPGSYDVVILGSAVYAGKWRSAALDYVEKHKDSLMGRPVWLFSSGPIGDPPLPDDEPTDMLNLAREISAWGETVFAGKLVKADLSIGEKLIVAALHAPDGDFRDWGAIDDWADQIARLVHAESAA